MKTIISWINYVLVQIIIFGLLFAWKQGGNEHAGNLFQAILWFAAIVGMLAAFLPARGSITRYGAARLFIGKVNAILLLALLCWFGHFFMVVAYIFGMVGMQIYRDQFDAEGKPLPPTPRRAHSES